MKMYRIPFTIIILLVGYSSVSAQKKSGKQQYERDSLTINVRILASVLKGLSPVEINPPFFNDNKKPYVVLNAIINRLISGTQSGSNERNNLDKLKQRLNPFLVDNPQRDGKGIIVLQHPFNRDVFYKTNADKLIDTGFKKAQGDVKALKSGLETAKDKYIANLALIQAALKNSDNQQALQLLSLNQTLNQQIVDITTQLGAAQSQEKLEFGKVYRSVPRYLEDSTKVDQIIAGGEGDENYFLNTKKVLVVLIGNTKRLRDTRIALTNKERIITGDIRDIIKLANSVTGAGGPVAKSFEPGDDDSTSIVKFSFLIPTDTKIRPPYEIRIASDKLKDTIQVHELVKFRLKVAFGAGQADVSYFGLKNNQLVFNPDSARKSVLKSSLAALISWYPWGQDIDHIDGPLYTKPLQRLSIAGGLRISKDPLEALFLGLNYDFQKNFGIYIGRAWYSSTLTNVVPLNTPSNVVGYLRDTGKREYKGQFFFGLTMAPAAIGDLLGLNKK